MEPGLAEAPTDGRARLNPVELVDIEPGDPRLEKDLLAVLLELRPHLTAAALAHVYDEGHPQGLRFLAAYDLGRCVGVAGWRFVATTAAGRKLYIDDLVTLETERGRGVGASLVRELVARAMAGGCSVIDLDSGLHRAAAHRFYMDNGFTISSFHFVHRPA